MQTNLRAIAPSSEHVARATWTDATTISSVSEIQTCYITSLHFGRVASRHF